MNKNNETIQSNEYILINEENFEEARKKIAEAKKRNKLVIFASNDDELNRKVAEKQEFDFLLLNLSKRNDFSKQRSSGLNQVLAKIAKRNKISVAINLSEIINSKPEEKSKILARIRQNIKICNKNKINMAFIALNSKDKREIHNLKSLGLVLGMPTWMTKNLKQIVF